MHEDSRAAGPSDLEGADPEGPTDTAERVPVPAWKSWLDHPLSRSWCVAGMVVATAVFVAIVQLLGGPTPGDANITVGATWAIAHGQMTCAFPRTGTSVAPLYPLLSGGLTAAARIGHGVPFPTGSSLGPSCEKAQAAFNAWSHRGHALPGTLRLGYAAWIALLAGTVALLRASGRGRRGWEPATLVVLACLPPVWMCVETYFHPQDLLAMGFALAAMACARRDAWIGAGILIALAVLSQQFAVLVAIPLVVVVPLHRRVQFVLAALATAGVVTLALLAASAGHAARDVLIGTGETTLNDGTLMATLHLKGVPLFLAARLAPLVLSFLVSVWVVSRRGRTAALEPVVLVSLVSLSLSLRLVFDPSLYGYYFMALAVTLVLLDAVRGRIRSGLVAWLLAVSLTFTVGPNWFPVFWRLSWGHLGHALPTAIFVLAVVITVLQLVRRGLQRELLVWIALAGYAAFAWSFARAGFLSTSILLCLQALLVLPGMALAALPLTHRMRSDGAPLRGSSRPSDVPVPQTN